MYLPVHGKLFDYGSAKINIMLLIVCALVPVNYYTYVHVYYIHRCHLRCMYSNHLASLMAN